MYGYWLLAHWAEIAGTIACIVVVTVALYVSRIDGQLENDRYLVYVLANFPLLLVLWTVLPLVTDGRFLYWNGGLFIAAAGILAIAMVIRLYFGILDRLKG